MRVLRSLVFVLHFVASALFGQNAPAPKPAAQPTPAPPLPTMSMAEPFYPLTPEAKARIRDFQYESDQLEIDNNKLLLQVEKNKARQAELMDGEKSVAFEFANQKKIDLSQYDLDPKEVRFIKKKKTGP